MHHGKSLTIFADCKQSSTLADFSVIYTLFQNSIFCPKIHLDKKVPFFGTFMIFCEFREICEFDEFIEYRECREFRDRCEFRDKNN